jgi:hypothetical protein
MTTGHRSPSIVAEASAQVVVDGVEVQVALERLGPCE